MNIAIALKIWKTGGAENGYKRLTKALPMFKWNYVDKIDRYYDAVIYSNSHDFYLQSIKHKIPKIILRTTGPRSYSLPQPKDLSAVVCSSKAAYKLSNHHKKHLIYNGVDLDNFSSLKPIPCDLLYSPARIGIGQRVEKAAEYARSHKRQLTCLGSRQHVAEDIESRLKVKYPEVDWVGLVSPTKAARYMLGCNDYICPTNIHGVSNAIIEAVAARKPIINLGGVEIPNRNDIDINKNSIKWYRLLK